MSESIRLRNIGRRHLEIIEAINPKWIVRQTQFRDDLGTTATLLDAFGVRDVPFDSDCMLTENAP
jgi:hypothetical protein